MKKFFKFENENIDFPFYNGKPLLSTPDWLILLAGVLAFIGLLFIRTPFDNNTISVLLCLSVLIPIIYVSKGKFELIFRKPKRKDIKLIILCLIGYYIYTLSITIVIDVLHMAPVENAVFSVDMNLVFWITVFIQLLGEELYKLSVFLILMHLLYKFTNDRKISLICSAIMTLLSFGLLHYHSYNGNLAQIICVIGIGGLIYFYPYLKTKNIVIAYIVHILIDAIPFLISTIYQI
jgi:hypothetical protein